MLLKNGLTITMKLKLIPSPDDASSLPRFIVDSGGHHGQGVSIYLVRDELYAEVAITNSTWKVITGSIIVYFFNPTNNPIESQSLFFYFVLCIKRMFWKNPVPFS